MPNAVSPTALRPVVPAKASDTRLTYDLRPPLALRWPPETEMRLSYLIETSMLPEHSLDTHKTRGHVLPSLRFFSTFHSTHTIPLPSICLDTKLSLHELRYFVAQRSRHPPPDRPCTQIASDSPILIND